MGTQLDSYPLAVLWLLLRGYLDPLSLASGHLWCPLAHWGSLPQKTLALVMQVNRCSDATRLFPLWAEHLSCLVTKATVIALGLSPAGGMPGASSFPLPLDTASKLLLSWEL